MTAARGRFVRMSPKVNLNFEKDGEKSVVRLEGRFTLDDKELFQKFVEQHVDGSTRYLIIDTSSLDFIDSAGIGDLIKLKMGPGKGYEQLYVMGLSDSVERVFRVSGLIQLFETIDDEAYGKL